MIGINLNKNVTQQGFKGNLIAKGEHLKKEFCSHPYSRTYENYVEKKLPVGDTITLRQNGYGNELEHKYRNGEIKATIWVGEGTLKQRITNLFKQLMDPKHSTAGCRDEASLPKHRIINGLCACGRLVSNGCNAVLERMPNETDWLGMKR